MADYSAANRKFVFNAYRYALGTNEITGFNENNIVLSWVIHDIPTITNVKGWFEEHTKDPMLRYSEFMKLPESTVQLADTYLRSVQSTSVNKDTEALPEYTYQNMCDVPTRYYLFQKGSSKYLSACPVTASFDYHGVNTSGRHLNALVNEYDLTNHYDQSSYYQLSIPEDDIIESRITQTADDVHFKDDDDKRDHRDSFYNPISATYTGYKGRNRNILSMGAVGYLLSWRGDNMAYEDMIPMEYYQFENPIRSNFDAIDIKWNVNGFIEAE